MVVTSNPLRLRKTERFVLIIIYSSGRRKKQVNQTDFPIEVIERVARCLWPEIQADFENEAIQKEFAEWLSHVPGCSDKPSAA